MKRIYCAILVCILLLIPVTSFAEDAAKEATYQRAVEFLEAGEYDMAISIFEMLGDYSDSAAQILVCKNAKSQIYYDRACELFSNGEYDAAKEVFLMLGTFSDSQIQAVRCETQKKQDQYDAASKLAESGDYIRAKEAFILLGEFSDSTARVEQMDRLILASEYETAKSYEDSGEYAEAIAIYESLGEYEDAADRIEFCQLQIHIANLSGMIEEALDAEPFNASSVYSLLLEGTTHGLDQAYIAECYDDAYTKEMYATYGEDTVYVDADMDNDGTMERILSANGSMTVLKRSQEGLVHISTTENADYTEFLIITDPSQRKYLQCFGESETGYDIYLLENDPALINTDGSVAYGTDIDVTASGFILNETLTANPWRGVQTEYIVLSGSEVIVNASPVRVDMNNYPAVTSADLLLRLYHDAVQYNSVDEMQMLRTESADVEQLDSINQWITEHESIDRADIILWNSEAQCFVGMITSGNDTIYVRMNRDSAGNFSLLGLY